MPIYEDRHAISAQRGPSQADLMRWYGAAAENERRRKAAAVNPQPYPLTPTGLHTPPPPPQAPRAPYRGAPLPAGQGPQGPSGWHAPRSFTYLTPEQQKMVDYQTALGKIDQEAAHKRSADYYKHGAKAYEPFNPTGAVQPPPPDPASSQIRAAGYVEGKHGWEKDTHSPIGWGGNINPFAWLQRDEKHPHKTAPIVTPVQYTDAAQKMIDYQTALGKIDATVPKDTKTVLADPHMSDDNIWGSPHFDRTTWDPRKDPTIQVYVDEIRAAKKAGIKPGDGKSAQELRQRLDSFIEYIRSGRAEEDNKNISPDAYGTIGFDKFKQDQAAWYAAAAANEAAAANPDLPDANGGDYTGSGGSSSGGSGSSGSGSATMSIPYIDAASQGAQARVDALYQPAAQQAQQLHAQDLASRQQTVGDLNRAAMQQYAAMQQAQQGVSSDLATQGFAPGYAGDQANMQNAAFQNAASMTGNYQQRMTDMANTMNADRLASIAQSEAALKSGIVSDAAALKLKALQDAASGGGGGGGRGSGSGSSTDGLTNAEINQAFKELGWGANPAQSGMSWLTDNYGPASSYQGEMGKALNALYRTNGSALGPLLDRYGSIYRTTTGANGQKKTTTKLKYQTVYDMLTGFKKQRNAYHKPQDVTVEQAMAYARQRYGK